MVEQNETSQDKIPFLIYDIECTGHLGYSYGLWDTNIHKVIEYPILLSYSYHWYDPERVYAEGEEPEVINVGIDDFDTFKIDPKNDKLITRDLWEKFNIAGITLGHNSKQFDDKMARMFFLKHNLPPTSPTKSIDTKQMAKAIGRFGSNSLNSLSDFFGMGQKTETTHADLWWNCLHGDLEAWAKMKVYNEQDVRLTIALYEKLRPWMLNHPNMARLNNNAEACPKCGVPDKMQSRGYRLTNVSKFRRYQCQACGGWCSRRIAVEKEYDVKPSYVNFPN